jgi:predicted DNA-binding protein YlxM (UPF0122 family)
MLEEIMKEFKTYREAVYDRIAEFMNHVDANHQKNAEKNTLSANALCELTTELDDRITALEDALASMMESADDTTTTTETSK